MPNCEKNVKCPCYKCLIFPLCQNEELPTLLGQCILLYAYLFKEKSGKNVILELEHFHTFCEVMGITLRKERNNTIINYKWQEGINRIIKL